MLARQNAARPYFFCSFTEDAARPAFFFTTTEDESLALLGLRQPLKLVFIVSFIPLAARAGFVFPAVGF